ncbi:MAG: nucleotidyltransferase [Sulfuritalea sp.]|nr:nucleotidyltransferase [Sulfuritalea sp.]
MFYVEPVATYDLDIFVVLPASTSGLLTLTPLYDALRQRGYEPKGEHVTVEGVPVQFLPAYNLLLEEALGQARQVEVEGVLTRVLRIEHLICIAAQTNRPKDWERIRLLTEEGEVDATLLAEICDRHGVALPASLGEN